MELFSLGWAKASVIGLNRWKAGFEMLLFGVVASSIGYGVGFLSKDG
jgi:VIT1/CCC1 family predicted Fe2+/Mn2+ transporter